MVWINFNELHLPTDYRINKLGFMRLDLTFVKTKKKQNMTYNISSCEPSFLVGRKHVQHIGQQGMATPPAQTTFICYVKT